MSTRCNIILKVKKSDIGRVIRFDESKLPVKLQEWTCYGNEVGEDKCKDVTIENEYLSIYCHNDGYPTGVGKALKEKFTDYETVLNLIAGGACSFVWFDSVRHYANRKNEKWQWLKPLQTGKVDVSDVYINYFYVFDGESWKMARKDKIGRVRLSNY